MASWSEVLGDRRHRRTLTATKEDDDDQWVANHVEVQRIAESIEARRIELGKTSGFERLYGRLTKLYFGSMTRHLADPACSPSRRLFGLCGRRSGILLACHD